MKFFSHSLTFKLARYFSLISLLTVSAVGAIALYQSRETLKQSIFSGLTTTAALEQEALKLWFDNQLTSHISLAQNSELQALATTLLQEDITPEDQQKSLLRLDQLLDNSILPFEDSREILLLHSNTGEALFSNRDGLITQSYGDQTFFQEGRYQPYIQYPRQGNSYFTFATPVKGPYQEFLAVLVMRVAVSELTTTLLPFDQPSPGQYAYLVSPDYYLLSQNQALLNAWESRKKAEFGLGYLAIIDQDQQKAQNTYTNFNQTPVFGIYRWLPEHHLLLVLEIDRNIALRPLRRLVLIVSVFGVGVVILSSLLGSAIAHRITKPILAIKDAATRVTQGNFNVTIPITSDDEVGILAKAFNQMTDELSLLCNEFKTQVTQLELAEISVHQSYSELQQEKKKVETIMGQLSEANAEISLLNDRLKTENLDLAAEIQATNERLNQILEAIPVGILVFDGQGEVIYVNHKAQLLLGDTELCLGDEHCPIYITEHNIPCPPEKMLGQRALNQRISTTYDDLEIRHPNVTIPLESWETPILDAAGTVKYAIVAFQDITERRQAEREKQDYTHKLWQLNQANERFVPRQFLHLLDKASITDVQLGDNVEKEMTALFSDIRGFTQLSELMTPEDNFKFINAFLSQMNPAISRHHGFVDKYIGDAIMALFSRSSHADDAIQAGIAMLRALTDFNSLRQEANRRPIKIGLGINSGLMRCGTVGGQQHMEGTVISDAVNLASRLERLTKTYKTALLISNHTFLQLKDQDCYKIRLIDHVKVTGKSIAVSVYEVFDADPEPVAEQKLATKSTFELAVTQFHLQNLTEAQELFQKCLRQTPQDRVSALYLKRCQNPTAVASSVSVEFFESGKL